MKALKFGFILLLVVTLPSIVPAAEDLKETASATVPLKEVLRLYQENAKAKQLPEKKPPVKATVNKIELSGRLLKDSIDLNAHFDITVLNANEWTTVPLLNLDSDTNISELPDLPNAVICKDESSLCLVTRKTGRYEFDLSLIKWAGHEAARRTVTIAYPDAVKAELNLHFDEDLFDIIGDKIIHGPEGVRIYPQNNCFAVTWQHRHPAMAVERTPQKRPPIESMVRKAFASSVSTLEGRLVTRVLYDLCFEGTKSISFVLPDDYQLERLYLNGTAVPFTVDMHRIDFSVLPARAGDQSATVELVLMRQLGNYPLSGALTFSSPKVSWPVHQIFHSIHLPAVFDYGRSGGSMAAVTDFKEPVYTFNLPQPGKRLCFHQYLVSATFPGVVIDYSIALSGKYFFQNDPDTMAVDYRIH